MATLRRDFLTVAGGAGIGLALSPAPWRLIGDSALWSQNWSWIPKTPRGEISYKPTACELCPAGCAVRARLAGTQPVSLWAVSQGAETVPLCPAGLCGHHLAFHPSRLRTTLRGGKPCAAGEPAKAASKALADKPAAVAVLDLRPGRTASLLYRKHLARLGGQYLTVTPTLGSTLQSIAGTTGGPIVPAFDLDNTGVLLSIGTPVMEAWDAPGRMLDPNRKFRLWHADALETATALAADRWFRIRPNSETAFAAGLVAAIDGDHSTLRRAADLTGIGEGELAAAARDLLKQNAVAVADTHPVLGPPARETLRAVACLNARLGAIGRKGGIIGRNATPLPKDWGTLAPETALDAVPDASLRFLFIDDATPGVPLPWKSIAAKLAPGALVVSASWSGNGIARRASYALPAVSYLEGLHDVPTPPADASARFALSLPLAEPASNAVEPVEWFGRLTGDETKLETRLKERAAAIHAAKRGELHSAAGEVARVLELKTAEAFWTAATAGGRWQDDSDALALKTSQTPQPPFHLDAAAAKLVLLPTAWMGADVSPLMTKLWVESSLRPRMQQVSMHPDTARPLALEHGARARITSSCGECLVEVSLDGAVQPGVIQMAAGEAWFALCETRDGAWRASELQIARKVVRA
jgi:menaquinone reductase, molybdopterin-binding-like subunit